MLTTRRRRFLFVNSIRFLSRPSTSTSLIFLSVKNISNLLIAMVVAHPNLRFTLKFCRSFLRKESEFRLWPATRWMLGLNRRQTLFRSCSPLNRIFVFFAILKAIIGPEFHFFSFIHQNRFIHFGILLNL